MKRLALALAAAVLAGCATQDRPRPVFASTQDLDTGARASLEGLLEDSDRAAELVDEAVGILVFPNIAKAGFVFGGQYGEGVLLKDGETAGYYDSLTASYGLQAGAQRYAYALFFTNEEALGYLDRSEGFELGVGPSIVFVNRGVGRNFTSTTLRADIYAFVYGQQGLMAGGGIQGTKINRVNQRRDVEDAAEAAEDVVAEEASELEGAASEDDGLEPVEATPSDIDETES